jgi:DNA-binding transcriptional LysR family regulator
MAGYSIQPDVLLKRAEASRDGYRTAQPYPHVVFDDFLPTPVVEAVLAEFPKPGDIEWQRFQNSREIKLACRDEALFGPATRSLIWELNSQAFLRFLEALTGIDNLIADPQLAGGGMHQIVRGGKLGVHVDFNKHGNYKLDRRLNLLLYLNKDWREEYGGHLELWDKDRLNCARRILPVFNRMALFATTESSWHGHPHPLACPEGWSRKSIALYYYTNGRDDGASAPEHSTVFREFDGGLVLLAESMLIRQLLPEWLLAVQRQSPGGRIQLGELHFGDVAPLRTGAADVLVGHLPFVPDDIAARRVADVHACLVAPAARVGRSGAAPTKDELGDLPFVAYPHGTHAHAMQQHLLVTAGWTPARVQTLANAEAVLGQVEAGLGWSLAPSLSPAALANPRLAACAWSGPGAVFPVYVAWRKDAPAHPMRETLLALAPRP